MAYDAIVFTPQASAPGSPATNEVYFADGDNRLYVCTDGTGAGGGAYSNVKLTEQASTPAASRGKVYLASADDHLYVCTAT